MELKEYFASAKGVGFLGTASASGEVDIAIYSRPRVLEDGTLVFGMTERLTHENLRTNPRAVYAFQEARFQGVRIFLEKVKEETAGPLLDEIRERADDIVGPGTGSAVRYAVHFRVTKVLPLVGS